MNRSFFFKGRSDTKLDEKNRFVLPMNMRLGLVEDGKLEFTIGLGLGGCLAIYRRSEIQRIAEKFQKNLHLAKYQKFFTLFFSTLYDTTCDKVGRLNLPSFLKEAANIRKEIVIAGVVDKIEIWSKEVYEKDLKRLLEGKDKEFSLPKLIEEAFSLLKEEASPSTIPPA